MTHNGDRALPLCEHARQTEDHQLQWPKHIRHDRRIDQAVRVTMWPRHGLPMTFHEQGRRFKAVRVHGNVHEMVAVTA